MVLSIDDDDNDENKKKKKGDERRQKSKLNNALCTRAMRRGVESRNIRIK